MAHDKNPNPLEDRRKAQEEEYFRKQNAALAEKLKTRLSLKQAGISDENLIDELAKLGFTADSVRALFLVPLIQVAWADGRMQDQEKETILSLLEHHGIEKGSEAYTLVSHWISKEPVDEKFTLAKTLIEPILEDLRKTDGGKTADWILEASRKVAEAAGGVFGIGNKISSEEEDLIRQIADRLGKSE